MKKTISLITLAAASSALLLTSCKPSAESEEQANDASSAENHDEHDHGVETNLGTFKIGELAVEAAQAHGEVEAGKESHLIIKLPYNDQGETLVRAWIGLADRTLSSIGKGEYAPSHNDYDIHMVAPDPLPEDSQWWIDIEKPNGTNIVGSFPFH